MTDTNKVLIIPEGADEEIYKAQVEAGEIEGEYKDEKPAGEHIDDGSGEGDQDDADQDKDKGDDGEKGKDKDGEGEGDEPPQPNRPVQNIPTWKHKEELKKATKEAEDRVRKELTTEFEQKLATASQKPGGATDEDIEAMADEFGIKPELVSKFAEKMASVIQSKIKVDLSENDRKALDTIAQTTKLAEEEKGFQDEWTGSATQTALKAVLGEKPITDEVRNKVKELAYSDRYHRYTLADIIALEGPKLFPKSSKTVEHSRGGAGRGPESKSIDEMTPEDIENLSDDDFLKLSNELGGKGSRFVGKPKDPKKK